jgi:hypothetical protein
MSQEVIEITEREIEVIEVVERGPSGPTGPQANINYTVVSSPQTLTNSQNIAADTSGGTFTLTLPAIPNEGDSIDIFDYAETFNTNPLLIARNGERIESLEEDLICNVEGAYFTMIYTGATRGWQILPRYGTTGGSGGGELTTQGDMLYRGAAVNERLPIGTAGQVLKVNSGATAPEWGTPPDSIDDYTGVTTSQTLVNGSRTAADTSGGAFTLTLPATPSDGDTVYLLDFASTFDTNNLTLGRNGSNIEGLAEDMVCNVEGSSFKMVYTGATSGWQMIPYYGTGVAIGSNATDVLSLSSGQIVADDPAADRLVFWDDSESKLTYLQAGSGLTIFGTTISASGGDTVSIDPSAADILTATSGAISADDAGSDKIVFWDDSENKLAYGSVGDVGAAAASHTHVAADVTDLGNSATLNTGTTAGTVATGDHTHELNALDATGATDSHVLTADGAGGAAFEAIPAVALNDLSNVSAATPSDNDVLVFDTATSTWVAEAAAAGGIASDTTGITGASAITNIVAISQADYDDIVSPDASTLFIITD